MGTNEQNKKNNIQFNIRVNKELKEQFNEIVKLSNIKNVDLINEILQEYYNKRVFTNDFLYFDKPFYFNIMDLFKNKQAKAINTPPETNQFNYYIVNGMPINFNAWNKNYNSYCFNNDINHHKGIILNQFTIDGIIFICFLAFEYINGNLNIKLYTLKELYLMINPSNKEIINQLEQEYNEMINYYNKFDMQFITDVIEPGTKNPIENISNMNYNLFKPFYIDVLINNLINELKANNQETINIMGVPIDLNTIERIFKENNKLNIEDKVLKYTLFNYCKEKIF